MQIKSTILKILDHIHLLFEMRINFVHGFSATESLYFNIQFNPSNPTKA